MSDNTRRRIGMVQVITSVLASALEVDDVLRIVSQHASIFGADVGVVGVIRDDVLELRDEWGYQRDELTPYRMLPLSASTPPTDCVRSGAPIVLATRAALLERYPHLARPTLGEHAFISLPLRADAEVIGTISLRMPGGTPLFGDHIDHLLMITQQIALALARAQLYQQVRAQNQFERKLMAVLSHDLRTPLSAIVMAAALLPREQREVAGLADRIERSATRMAELISSMLEMRVQRTAPRILARDDIDLGLADQIAELRAAFPHRAIDFVPGLAGARVSLDTARASQIVANLVRNALEHGDPAGPITVTTSATTHAIEIAVHNLGAPIAPALQQVIFQPFERASAAGRGSGLGLYIVKELTERMGGTVTVDSGVTGTTFVVRFATAAA